MELRYCELCGDIIKVQEGAAGQPDDQYVCERCSAKNADGGSRHKRKAEDVPLRGTAPVDGQPQQPEPDPAASDSDTALEAVPKEITLNDLIDKNELELFSADTVARRRKQGSASVKPSTEAMSKTKIRLLDPDEPGRVSGESPAKPGPATATESPAAPSLPRERLQFLCPACRVTLTVKPSTKTLRVRCPRCRSRMAVDTGRHVKLLEAGTSVIRGGRGAEGDVLGAPLCTTNPNAPPSPAPSPHEGLLSAQSMNDLMKMTGTKVSLPPPRPAVAATERAPLRPSFDIDSAHEPPLSLATPSYSTPAVETSSAFAAAGKALLLAGVLTAPFYVWAGLLALSGNEQYVAYFQAFGEIVQEFLTGVFGG